MDNCTRGLPFVFPYIDDILVASDNKEQHLEHLAELFKRLQEYGLVINFAKYQLGLPEVIFLGYHINMHGISPIKGRVQDILDIPPSNNGKGLRRFPGAFNSYRKFMKGAASVMAPLNDLLKGSNVRSTDSIPWTDTLSKAFSEAKQLLAEATLVVYPNVNSDCAIFTDASETGIGAVLQKLINDDWQPLAFFSRNLPDSLRKLSAYDRELHSVFKAVRHFRHIFEGRHVTIYTDHKTLSHAFQQSNECATPWQFRRWDIISQFTTDVRHIVGKDNIVADSLSRVDAVCLPFSYMDLADAQRNDQELQHLRNSTATSLKLKRTTFCRREL